ncbi:hypothetical protein DFH06DRAFT_1133714 [Mycena polygramma]|nr:hypothetical protein DFH06DRAFT_1133714 [Mycena polygramma]
MDRIPPSMPSLKEDVSWNLEVGQKEEEAIRFSQREWSSGESNPRQAHPFSCRREQISRRLRVSHIPELRFQARNQWQKQARDRKRKSIWLSTDSSSDMRRCMRAPSSIGRILNQTEPNSNVNRVIHQRRELLDLPELEGVFGRRYPAPRSENNDVRVWIVGNQTLAWHGHGNNKSVSYVARGSCQCSTDSFLSLLGARSTEKIIDAKRTENAVQQAVPDKQEAKKLGYIVRLAYGSWGSRTPAEQMR